MAKKKKNESPEKEVKDTKKAKTAEEKENVEETAENTKDTIEEPSESVQEEDIKDEETKEDQPKKKKEKKDPKDEKIEELTDRVKRSMAEFENFRKRTEKEKSQMFETGAKSIVEKVLPVVDSFERAFDSVPEEEEESPFVDGMKKIFKQLTTVLDEAGVTAIEALGKEFDPELHNAVMHVDDDNYGENEVIEEFQKGYMYRDSVVRHSMVKVAN